MTVGAHACVGDRACIGRRATVGEYACVGEMYKNGTGVCEGIHPDVAIGACEFSALARCQPDYRPMDGDRDRNTLIIVLCMFVIVFIVLGGLYWRSKRDGGDDFMSMN
jgi:hypothetical protein